MAGELNKKPVRELDPLEAAAIVEEGRENLQKSWENDKDNRIEALRDLRFLANDHWPEAVRRQREKEGRPVITINDLPQFLRQVTNDIRQADLAIKVAPVDNRSDPKIAKIYNGLLRQIQSASSAKAIYASAAEHQCGCGIGWFEIITEYCDDETFDQQIKLKRIPYPLAVYDDPNAVEPDRSDSMFRNITFMMTKKAFERKYPNAKAEAIQRPSDGGEWLPWAQSDKIRVSEGGEEAHGFYDDALGLNGGAAREKAQGTITSDPLFTGKLAQDQNAMLRYMNARGAAGSGKTQLAGQRILNDNYGSWLNRYKERAGQGATMGNAMSQLKYGYGATKAGTAINYGNARSEASNVGVNNVLNLAGTAAKAAAAFSDRRLKRDVKRIGSLPSGLPTYRFKYVWSDDEFEGVMADEVAPIFPEAVTRHPSGFMMVDYSAIG